MLARKENVFYEHPESSRYANIKLQECTAIAVNFFLCAQLGRYSANGGLAGGRWHI